MGDHLKDVVLTLIRSQKGYRFVNEMSLSRDVLITLIRSEHGYRYVIKMSLLSIRSFKKVTLTLIKDALKVSGIMYLTTMFCKDCYQIHSPSGYVSYINSEGGLVSTSLEKQGHNK